MRIRTNHYCPNCKKRWKCQYIKCGQAEEMLCPKCDTVPVREKLGGKWIR